MLDRQPGAPLDDALARIAQSASAFGHGALALQAQRIAEQLRRRDVTVVVAGQFKRGKSTLVNALIGAPILPMGALPLTAVPTIVRGGGSLTVEVRFRDGRILEIDPDRVAEFATEERNPRNHLDVERVVICVPSPMLAGITLVDTPGIASTYLHNTGLARETLREADLALLVVGPDPPIGEAELAFAAELREAAERLFVVFSKADLAAEHLDELLDFTCRTLAAVVGDEPRIFPLSAKEALATALRGGRDPELERLEQAIAQSLAHEPEALLQRSASRRMRHVAAKLSDLLAIERAALGLPMNERRSQLERCRNLARALDDQIDEARARVERAAARALGELDPTLDELAEGARAELSVEIPRAAGGGDRAEAERLLGERLASLCERWPAAVQRRIAGPVVRALETFLRQAQDIERQLLAAGLQTFGLTQTAAALEEEPLETPAFSVVFRHEPDTGLELLGQASFALLPRAIRSTQLRRTLRERVRTMVDAQRGRLRYAVLRAVDESVREASERLTVRLRSAAQAVTGALEAAAATHDDGDACRRIARLDAAMLELDELVRAPRESLA